MKNMKLTDVIEGWGEGTSILVIMIREVLSKKMTFGLRLK